VFNVQAPGSHPTTAFSRYHFSVPVPMDPLSLIGAISTAIKLLSLVATVATDLSKNAAKYKTFAKDLKEHQEITEDCRCRINEWSRGWGLETTGDATYGLKVWGVDGWRRVCGRLSKVDENCLEVVSSLAEFELDEKKIVQYSEALEARRAEEAAEAEQLRDNSTTGKVRKPSKLQKARPLRIKAKHDYYAALPNERQFAIQARKDERKAISKLSDVAKKLEFVFGKRGEIIQQCSDLKSSVDYLEQRSLQIFLSRYTHLGSSASIDDRIAAIEERHMALENAESLRKAAILLYQHCARTTSEHQRDIRIAVESIAARDLEENISTYRVLYEPTGTHAQELTVQCLSSRPVGDIFAEFDEAWAAASVQENVHFSSTLDAYYALKRLALSPVEPQESLAESLESLDSKGTIGRHTKFPISQRQALAYQIAGSALRLLGTSWLSALSSKNITPFRKAHNSEYLLRVLQSDQRRCGLLQRLERHGASGRIDVQLWSVGILLFEIMMGAKVTEIIEKHDRPYALRLIDWSIVEVDGPGFQNMLGFELGGAVAQCFKANARLYDQDMSTDDYHAALMTFYEAVYLP
jgi:hypothetical protein